MSKYNKRKLVYHTVFIILETICVFILVSLLNSKNIPMIIIAIAATIIGGFAGFGFAIYRNRKLQKYIDTLYNLIKDSSDVSKQEEEKK